MKHFTRLFITLILAFVFGFFVSTPAYAMEFRGGEGDVLLKQNEVVSGSLFIAGDRVEVDGSVEGDIYCAGKTVVIRGSVGGDVVCAGQTIDVIGDVAGNVRSAGQVVMVEGVVGKNGTMVGQTVTLRETSAIGGELYVAGQTVTSDGAVAQSAAVAGETILVNGIIGGDMKLAGTTVEFGDSAQVYGTVHYQSESEARIAPGAQLTNIKREPMPKEVASRLNSKKDMVPHMFGFSGVIWPLNALKSIIVHLLFALLFVLLFQGSIARVVDMIGTHPKKSLGLGIVVCVTFPVIFLAFLVTLIGIPLAILYAILFACAVFVSKLAVAFFIGKAIVRASWKEQETNWYTVAVIGVIVSWLVFYLPFVGWMISGIATLFGMGAITGIIFRQDIKKKK